MAGLRTRIEVLTVEEIEAIHGGATSLYSSRTLPYLVEIEIIIRGSEEELKKRSCFHFSTSPSAWPKTYSAWD